MDNMDIPLPMHLHVAIALQTLALPGTLILCFTSMLRERSIGDQNEKQLVRLYKQHAIALELVQVFVTLMACGLVTGNTVAALESRALVIGFAGEDATAMIVKSWLVRNIWFLASAFCTLACMSMLDSWSLPRSTQDLTDPLFRLTREVVAAYIWKREAIYYSDVEGLSLDELKWHYSSVYADGQQLDTTLATPTRELSDDTTTPLILSTEEKRNPTNIASPPQLTHEIPNAPSTETLPSPINLDPPALPTSTSKTPPPIAPTITTTHTETAHPPANRPHYQTQTHSSALRITSKPSKSALSTSTSTSASQSPRTRKRSVTFALQPTSSSDKDEAEGRRKRSRSSVRERARRLEDSVLEERVEKYWERVEGSGISGRVALAVESKRRGEESGMAKSCGDEELVVLDDLETEKSSD